MKNINQARIPAIRCQMLHHILKKARANDKNEKTVDAAYDVDNDEEDDASQANDNIDAVDVDAVNNNEDDGGLRSRECCRR